MSVRSPSKIKEARVAKHKKQLTELQKNLLTVAFVIMTCVVMFWALGGFK